MSDSRAMELYRELDPLCSSRTSYAIIEHDYIPCTEGMLVFFFHFVRVVVLFCKGAHILILRRFHCKFSGVAFRKIN